ncbi:MAG: FecR family protein [Proteobacteria bacterium]|nr:FecR family protein [Pseudomonadota bacterium]
MKRHLIFLLFTVLILPGWACLSFADNKTDTNIVRGKSVSESLLPDELKSIKVEDYFIKSNELPAGTIQKASGHVVVVHKDTNKAYYAINGDTVYQQDVFYTLKDSRCRIRFNTEDVIIMGENGKIIVEEVTEDNVSKSKKSVMSMLRGKAMFYVVRLFKYKSILASVKTPTAVMGVRGTKFGVEVRKAGEKIADLSDESLIYLAENGSGNFETIIYGFDGTVDVTSVADGSTNSVGAGENLFIDNLGAGNVEPTDPNIANQFIQQTEGGGFILSGIPGSIEEVAGDNIIINTDSSDSYMDNVSQTLTGLTIDESARPVNKFGYFTSMLTMVEQNNNYTGTYISTSMQNLDHHGAVATDIVYENGDMKLDASGGLINAKLTDLQVNEDTISGNYPVSFSELGHNVYLEWGYWTQTAPMNVNSYSYVVDNRGYYIVGDPTLANDMAILHNLGGWWSYTGGAEGTFWTNTGGDSMTGSFDAKVNFMENDISEYNLSVTGGGHSASVTDASGVLTNESPNFSLSGGNSAIDGQQATFSAYGSFYGPAAQGIGGAWSINPVSTGGHATGIFHGSNQGPTAAP